MNAAEDQTGARPSEAPSSSAAGDDRALAHAGDTVVGIDIHIVDIPSPAGPVPTPLPHPFKGKLDRQLSADVLVDDEPAATVDSLATNDPGHVAQGGSFKKKPTDEARVKTGAAKVLINDKAAARAGDSCWSCNDPMDLPTGVVIASGTVVVGEGKTPEVGAPEVGAPEVGAPEKR